jgi:glutamine synthetase type III
LKNEYENQWVSTTNDDMIQFNTKGVFVFFTFNIETYNKLVRSLNKSTYKNFGKTIKNGVEVDSYIRENETIFITTMAHPQNGKQVYSLTFLS